MAIEMEEDFAADTYNVSEDYVDDGDGNEENEQVESAVGKLLPMGVSFDPVVPSFLWSPHQHRSDGVESVNYKPLSPKDLPKSVMSEGGWSNLLISLNLEKPDSVLINFLKDSFVNSNFSLAFPYIAISEEGESSRKRVKTLRSSQAFLNSELFGFKNGEEVQRALRSNCSNATLIPIHLQEQITRLLRV
nr:2-C-methyl-D-erythritol 4-phosphate cytidylyltransferase [Ipomoea batatas]